MKKGILAVITIFVISLFLFSSDLSKLYRNGKADFKVDKSFGKDTEWDMFFPTGISGLVFKKDGSFFATSMGGRDHYVFYFNKNGKLIKKIGQKGEGPGDFYHPGDLSILDNKYLIIGEYASKRRISVFDLNGKFVKILRVKGRNCFDPTAISRGKIVYYSYGKEKTEGNFTTRKINFYIKDVKSGKEKKIKILFEDIEKKKERGLGTISLIDYFDPKIFIKKIRDNKMLLSFSSNPKIYICSLDGKVLKTFYINLEKKKMSEKTKNIIYNYFYRELRKKDSFYFKVLKRMMKNNTLFRDFYPLYSEITIDSDNNILFWEIIKGIKINKENNELEIGGSIISFTKYLYNGKFLRKYSIDLSDDENINFNSKYIFNNAAYVYSDENGLQRILLD
jgi:hypothetical protein